MPGALAPPRKRPYWFRQPFCRRDATSQPRCQVLLRAPNFPSDRTPRVRPFAACARLSASADFWRPIVPPLGWASCKAERQISRGKARDLHSIYPARIRPSVPGGIGLRVRQPPRPPTDASDALRVPRAGALPRTSSPRTLASPQLSSARGSRHQGPQGTCTPKSRQLRFSPPCWVESDPRHARRTDR